MNFWWCNQGQPSWFGERNAGIVCATGDDSRGLTFRRTVSEVKTGDITLHYRKGFVLAFSRAKENGEFFKKLPNVNGENYPSGWRFRAEYYDLPTPLAKSDFVEDLIPSITTGYPINKVGNPKQGYFFRFDHAGIRLVLKHVPEPIPDWLSRFRDPNVSTFEQVFAELEARIKSSQSLTDAERIRKIAAAPDFPEQRQVISMTFDRNEHVIVSVLKRAKGICEKCRKKAPFIRRSNRSPYLEVHHTLPLCKGGKDKVENAVALCPNCHREEHHG
jgi:hypothetical protein